MKKFTKRVIYLFLFSIGLFVFSPNGFSQGDTLSPAAKKKFTNYLNNFNVSVYMDVYYGMNLNRPSGDTSNLREFAGNSPFINEFRLNVASIWLDYSGKNFRGKLRVQYGDIPDLLAAPNEQFIKHMKEAHFGFRVYKTFWMDFGFIPNPIGYESSYPILNQISTVTVGGYFETGNFLGFKASVQFTPSFFAGLYIGNQYTLAYGKNDHIYGGLSMTYNYKDIFSVNYNNMIGNASLSTDKTDHFYLYNNLILTAKPVKNLLLVGEIDVGVYGNSNRPPDTANASSGISGFLQATYRFTNWFSTSIRGEYFNDPGATMTPLYAYDGKLRGLLTYGGTVGVEFNPVPYSYLRAEYSYITADKGNMVFNGNLTDDNHTITFTAGLRFGTF